MNYYWGVVRDYSDPYFKVGYQDGDVAEMSMAELMRDIVPPLPTDFSSSSAVRNAGVKGASSKIGSMVLVKHKHDSFWGKIIGQEGSNFVIQYTDGEQRKMSKNEAKKYITPEFPGEAAFPTLAAIEAKFLED